MTEPNFLIIIPKAAVHHGTTTHAYIVQIKENGAQFRLTRGNLSNYTQEEVNKNQKKKNVYKRVQRRKRLNNKVHHFKESRWYQKELGDDQQEEVFMVRSYVFYYCFSKQGGS